MEALTPRLILLSGLSGAGKTVALNALEDLDFFCVDNLPAGLLQAFVRQTLQEQPDRYPRVAVGIDARNRPEHLARMPEYLSEIGALEIPTQLWFLDSSAEVLVKRFSETRRRHPLSGVGVPLTQAIAEERALLREIASIADQRIDTSAINVHQLRRQVIELLQVEGTPPTLMFESFAFRRGVPADADFVFDARALPNPHWDARLRPLTGRDAAVREFLAADPEVQDYYNDLRSFLGRWLWKRELAQRSYLTVAIGCTGGRHRSVYLAEALAEAFHAVHPKVVCFHRELS